MKKLLTDEIVIAAVRQLEAKGEPINPTKIRLQLGYGSHKTIADVLATIQGTKAPADDPAAAEAFKALWQQAVAKGAALSTEKIRELEGAIAFLDGENDRLEAARDEAADRLHKAQATVEKLVNDMAKALDDAGAARQGREDALATLAHERQQQRAEMDALRRQLAETENARREAEIKGARAEGELAALKTKPPS